MSILFQFIAFFIIVFEWEIIKHIINALIIILLFVSSVAIMILSIMLREGDWGVPKGLGILITFLLIFGITAFSLSKFESRIRWIGVIIPIVIGILLLTLPKALSSTLKFSLKIAPFYISIILGLLSAYLYHSKERSNINIPLILGAFPLFMALGSYDMWVHRIEYGNWSGDVAPQQVSNFSLKNKAGDTVNNQTLKGKIVLFDFWFISCRPCWVKFPELQRLYEKYQLNSKVELYAVNRPMRSDKPGELFSRIEKKEYSFPVLKGTQEVMDNLNIYKYPTVMILDTNGEMVFMGEIEDAEDKLESMVKKL